MTNVLIVEDNADSREVIAAQMDACGYAPHVAETRDDAIKMMKDGIDPDLILMDIMMPGMSLDDFMTQLPSVTKKKVPVVLETCSPAGQDEADRLRTYYLPKAFTSEDLKRTVDLCLS